MFLSLALIRPGCHCKSLFTILMAAQQLWTGARRVIAFCNFKTKNGWKQNDEWMR